LLRKAKPYLFLRGFTPTNFENTSFIAKIIEILIATINSTQLAAAESFFFYKTRRI